MARKHNLAEVLQTEVSGSMPLKTLAKVLASKGRRGDTMLAHITPKEAKKLKKMGGSGTTNPETGLPEFFGEDGFDYPVFDAPAVEAPAPVVEAPVQADMPPFQAAQVQSPDTYAQTFGQADLPANSPYSENVGVTEAGGFGNFASNLFGGGQQAGTAVSATGTPLPPPRGFTAEQTADYYSQGATPEDQGVQTQIQPTSEDVAKAQGGDSSGLLGKMGLSDLLKLGVGGIGALMGRSQQQAAIKQAAAAAQQYKDAAAAASQQYKDLAQPLLGPGYSALSQANQGTLSAANRQAFDVARARAAQASSRSGGVGAVQTAMEEGRMYQQLVSTQLQQAMQLIAPGNSLASAAISTTLAGQQGALGLQLQLEQQANQAATNMYSALAKMVA